MIRHLVLFKLNEGVTRDQPDVAAGAATWKGLGARVPGVAFWECAWNVSERAIAYDFAINAAFTDRDALQRFLDHPAHLESVARWRTFSTWVIADYAFPQDRAGGVSEQGE